MHSSYIYLLKIDNLYIDQSCRDKPSAGNSAADLRKFNLDHHKLVNSDVSKWLVIIKL